MIHITYPMALAGSGSGAKLTVYIQEDSPELDILERPLVLVCPGGPTA